MLFPRGQDLLLHTLRTQPIAEHPTITCPQALRGSQLLACPGVPIVENNTAAFTDQFVINFLRSFVGALVFANGKNDVVNNSEVLIAPQLDPITASVKHNGKQTGSSQALAAHPGVSSFGVGQAKGL